MPLRHLEERALDKYFDSIRHLPLLTAEEERKNGHLWQDDRNPEGLRALVEGNLRFVVKEARKFEGMGLDLLDLISDEGEPSWVQIGRGQRQLRRFGELLPQTGE